MKKINLRKNGGPIIFLGSTNAMPMMYALELKKLGYDVIYFVDRPKNDLLNRPECHFSQVSYPYPDWIVELKVPSQLLVPLHRTIVYLRVIREIKKLCDGNVQAIFLNSMFITMSHLFIRKDIPVISLSHGGDLDSWADLENIDKLKSSFSSFSFLKYLPKKISYSLIDIVAKRQFKGFCNSTYVLYFPKGFNKNGDSVISKLERLGVIYVPRFDISFSPLQGADRTFKANSKKLILFSGVRFTFKSFSEGNEGYNKGNDEIIKGISLFYRENRNIEVHFVEKGLDLRTAKEMCEEYEIADCVVWHKEMKFSDLIRIYEISDICFDQVGDHWIGAIGGYALYLGKPLIANDVPHTNSEIWPADNPVLSANDSTKIYEALKVLSCENKRRDISSNSIAFAEEYLKPNKVLGQLFSFE